MKKQILMLVCGVAATAFALPQAQALPPFKKAFKTKYVEDASEEFQAAFKKAGCNACHVKDEKKDQVNEYGQHLAKLIEGNAKQRLKDAKKEGKAQAKAMKAKILEELEAAFGEVEGLKSSSGETYLEKIKAGKLPAAE